VPVHGPVTHIGQPCFVCVCLCICATSLRQLTGMPLLSATGTVQVKTYGALDVQLHIFFIQRYMKVNGQCRVGVGTVGVHWIVGCLCVS
jgi:hypothetical protein